MTRHRPATATRRKAGGFTLLEVMIALGILGFSLSVLVKSASNTMGTAARSHMMGVATELSRGKMYDIEETLLKDGFTDTDQSQDNRDFSEEGWPQIKYSFKVEQVELPSWDDLQSMTQKQAEGAGSGSGSASFGGGDANSFQNSALGGMLSSLGGGFGGTGGDVDAKNGASFIQGQYSMVSEVLKVSIRKVTLTVTYPIPGNDPENMVTVAYFTDAAAMDKVLMGLGSQEVQDTSGSGSGSGRGSGSGSGSGRGSGTRPTRPGSGGK